MSTERCRFPLPLVIVLRRDEYVTNNLSHALHQCAPTDKTIAARGVASFIQAVLIPELALMLIMEDMKLNLEEARRVLDQSRALGDQVNEEDDDAVRSHSRRARQIAAWDDGNDGD